MTFLSEERARALTHEAVKGFRRPFHIFISTDRRAPFGQVIDSLFNFILYLTGAIFIVVALVMFWFLWKYDAQDNVEPVKFVHGNHALELIWTLVPAVVLIFISFVQLNAWADQKMRRPILSTGPDGIAGTLDDILKPPLVEVTGRQFEWRYRYAGKDGVIGTRDDVHGVSELVIPMDEGHLARLLAPVIAHRSLRILDLQWCCNGRSLDADGTAGTWRAEIERRQSDPLHTQIGDHLRVGVWIIG